MAKVCMARHSSSILLQFLFFYLNYIHGFSNCLLCLFSLLIFEHIFWISNFVIIYKLCLLCYSNASLSTHNLYHSPASWISLLFVHIYHNGKGINLIGGILFQYNVISKTPSVAALSVWIHVTMATDCQYCVTTWFPFQSIFHRVPFILAFSYKICRMLN